MLVQILEQVINGLLAGAYYLLIALGLRRRADSILDPSGAQGADSRRRLHLFALPAADARGRRDSGRRPVVPTAANAVRSRGARRRPESRHGGGAGHFARPLHGEHRRHQRRVGGAGRRAAGADLGRTPGDGRRDPDRIVRRGGDRRPGLVLGGGPGGADRWRRPRTHRLFLPAGRRSVDVRADAPRAAVPAARALRRADSALRMIALRSPVVLAGMAMIVLPFALLSGGLTMTSATDVVIFAIACMALNVLVGNTGLVSFGHGAWFGIGAYAAALAQRHWFAGSVLWPTLFALAFLVIAAIPIAFLVLRRRGVYFSLLTLAFTALAYAIAFRWTAFTGGENGLGGVTRANWLGLDLENRWAYYGMVAITGFLVAAGLRRFHRSPIGTVLVAIRENEQRAQFVGYATRHYKQVAYVLSAVLTGFAGVLFAFHHRFASADPTAIAFSGEMLAMVIIGGMRNLLGPALGALFFILFREYLSIWTPDWLLYFGLLFVAFIVLSPTGLVGLWQRLTEPMKPKVVEAAAMAGRAIEHGVALPTFLCVQHNHGGAVLEARDLAKSFGGIKAVVDASITVRDRSLHALIGPNGAGKTTMFNLISGLFVPDHGTVTLAGMAITDLPPYRIVGAGLARSFQITNLFPGVSIEENLRLAVQAHDPSHRNGWTDAHAIERVTQRTAELIRFLGFSGIAKAEAGLP